MIVLDMQGRGKVNNAKVVGSVEELLDWEKSSVVALFAVEYLQYEKDLEQFFKQAYRVIKPEGFLHILIPLAPYRNAFKDDCVHYFGTFQIHRLIDQEMWYTLNDDLSEVVKEDKNDPNTWERTLSLKLKPRKKDEN